MDLMNELSIKEVGEWLQEIKFSEAIIDAFSGNNLQGAIEFYIKFIIFLIRQ